MLAGVGAPARTAARAATTRRPATTEHHGRHNGFGRPNQRYTTDAPIVIDPNVPPKAADGTQPPNALYIGGAIIGRSLNRGGAMTVISPDADRRRPTPTDPTDAAARAGAGRGDRHRALRQPLRRDHAIAPAKSPTPVPVRAGDLRGHGHRQGVEDERRRRALDADAGPAAALGQRDHRRPGQRRPRLRRVLRLPRGRRRGQRLGDQRRRRDVARTSRRTCPTGRSR